MLDSYNEFIIRLIEVIHLQKNRLLMFLFRGVTEDEFIIKLFGFATLNQPEET